MEINRIYHGDWKELIKQIPDKTIDLTITDPPYHFEAMGGWLCDVGNGGHDYLFKLKNLKCCSFNPYDMLNELKRVMKTFNLVVFCNKYLIKDYLNFASDNNFLFDIHVMVKKKPNSC